MKLTDSIFILPSAHWLSGDNDDDKIPSWKDN